MIVHDLVFYEVLHPETKKAIAVEFIANDGTIWFVEPPGAFFEGVRVGPYPNSAEHGRLERVEIARLPPP